MNRGECWLMYYKIHELKRAGLGVTQIMSRVVLARNTIYTYLKMSEEQYADFIKDKNERTKKLEDKKPFVKGIIEQYPEIMATQVESKLKETYGELSVHSRTVNNFVNQLRVEFQIPKPEKQRIYEAVEELPYGKQAQVDFGQKQMIINKKKVRIYFFAISLSRSRYKYIFFQLEPFTSNTAIACFERSFAYFEGIPHEIVCDQDRVFMVDENYGDIILTEEFGRYVGTRPFNLNPCRGFDPESKGRVENVVKYVKYNFMSCREATDIDDLNKQALQWLRLTANGKEHQTTKKIPIEEFKIEQNHLLPYNKITIPAASKEVYDLRKDNLVIYKGNRYRVPAGTYKDKNSIVKIKRTENTLIISTHKNEELAKHLIPTTKGNLVGDKTHNRDYSMAIKDIYAEIVLELKDSEIIKEYLEKLKKCKSRYIRDQLSLLKNIIEKYGVIKTIEAIEFCNKNNIISVPDIKTVIERTEQNHSEMPTEIHKLNSAFDSLYADKRSIDAYSGDING